MFHLTHHTPHIYTNSLNFHITQPSTLASSSQKPDQDTKLTRNCTTQPARMQPRVVVPGIMVSGPETKPAKMQSSLGNEVRPHSRNSASNAIFFKTPRRGVLSPHRSYCLSSSYIPQLDPTSAKFSFEALEIKKSSPTDKHASTKTTSPHLFPPTPPRPQDNKLPSLIRRIFEVNNRDTKFLALWTPHLTDSTSTTCVRNKVALEMVAGLQNLRNREIKLGDYRFLLGMFWGYLSSYVLRVDSVIGLAVLLVYALVSWKAWKEIWDEESDFNTWV